MGWQRAGGDLFWFPGSNVGLHLREGALISVSCGCAGVGFDAQARYQGGEIQTSARTCPSCPGADCSTGWVDGYWATCTKSNAFYGTLIVEAATTASGVRIIGQKFGGAGGSCGCSEISPW